MRIKSGRRRPAFKTASSSSLARTYLVTAGNKQSLHPMANLFHILDDQDDRPMLWVEGQGLLYDRTSHF